MWGALSRSGGDSTIFEDIMDADDKPTDPRGSASHVPREHAEDCPEDTGGSKWLKAVARGDGRLVSEEQHKGTPGSWTERGRERGQKGRTELPTKNPILSRKRFSKQRPKNTSDQSQGTEGQQRHQPAQEQTLGKRNVAAQRCRPTPRDQGHGVATA